MPLSLTAAGITPQQNPTKVNPRGANRELCSLPVHFEIAAENLQSTMLALFRSEDQAEALLFILLVPGPTPPVIFLSTHIQYIRALFTVYTGFP